MNYLGHLLVLPHHGLLTLGNLLGDFVKGRPDALTPTDFRRGVVLHRQLDGFTDAHPVVARSKHRFPPELRRLSGVLTDVFYDHFWAQNLRIEIHRDSLLPFAAGLPTELVALPERMISSRWFGSYATVEGIGAVLARMDQRRMDQRRKRPLGLSGAEAVLETHYAEFARDAAEFFPDAVAFTREALLRLQLASPAEPLPGAVAATASDPPQTS